MALTLIKEDGTGKADANSYADVANSDAYHDGHLYASAWTAATADKKAAALVMATRLIDSQYQFNGFKVYDGQTLQWPRISCPDPDVNVVEVIGLLWRPDNCVASNVVPKAVVEATCEMARELLFADRTAAPAGEGLKYYNEGTTQTGYDSADRRPIISQVAQAMLAKYGVLIKSGSGTVRLVRA
ncbi:MAG TPA: DnaT-like ssDNA-binding protein [Verrucomicrobiae bacterium]|nr:DnaT-like ssDNA-binding protein [Verrucomicrobiae bacterium]